MLLARLALAACLLAVARGQGLPDSPDPSPSPSPSSDDDGARGATDEVRDDAADGERAAPAVVYDEEHEPCPYPWCAPVKRLIRHLLQCPSGPARCHGAARCRVCDPPDLPASLEKLRYLNVEESLEYDSQS